MTVERATSSRCLMGPRFDCIRSHQPQPSSSSWILITKREIRTFVMSCWIHGRTMATPSHKTPYMVAFPLSLAVTELIWAQEWYVEVSWLAAFSMAMLWILQHTHNLVCFSLSRRLLPILYWDWRNWMHTMVSSSTKTLRSSLAPILKSTNRFESDSLTLRSNAIRCTHTGMYLATSRTLRRV